MQKSKALCPEKQLFLSTIAQVTSEEECEEEPSPVADGQASAGQMSVQICQKLRPRTRPKAPNDRDV